MNRHVFGKPTIAGKMCDDVDYTQCNKHNAQIASDRSDLLPRISLVLVFGIVDVVIESLFEIVQVIPAHKTLLYLLPV